MGIDGVVDHHTQRPAEMRCWRPGSILKNYFLPADELSVMFQARESTDPDLSSASKYHKPLVELIGISRIAGLALRLELGWGRGWI